MESGLIAFLGEYLKNPTWGILLLTFFAYSMSYMLYSGYISLFAGGYGGIPLTQTGFNVIDLLTLVPTIFFMLANMLLNLGKQVIRWIFFAFIIPFGVAFLAIMLVRTTSFSFETEFATSLQTIGGLLWFMGTMLPIFYKNNARYLKIIVITISSFGAILFFLFAKITVGVSQVPGSYSTNTTDSDFFLFFLLLFLPLIIFAAGIRLAEISINEKLLSSVARLVLKTPIPLAQFQHIKPASQPGEQATNKKHWLLQKDISVQIQPDAYVWDFQENQLYLIAAFNQSIIFFVTSEMAKSDRGKMLIVANEQVLSMEINSRKMSETK